MSANLLLYIQEALSKVEEGNKNQNYVKTI